MTLLMIFGVAYVVSSVESAYPRWKSCGCLRRAHCYGVDSQLVMGVRESRDAADAGYPSPSDFIVTYN
jgi:hypothetical protein